jgi:acyl-CoA synthetase (AMP-forming)/AMP-acid ligase II
MSKPPPDPDETPAPVLPMCALVTAPLFHLSGLFAGAIMYLGLGAKTVWRSGRFDPADVLRLIEKEKVTAWGALGNMAHRVVSHPDVGEYDLSSMQNVGSGGAPTSPELQRRIREVFPRGGANMGIGYGSSESVAVIASIGGRELEERPTSVGPIQACTEVEIRDPDGNVLPEGEEGEIFARSPYVMLEYWRNPEATAEAIRPGRWLATGDIGKLDDGYLYINSRARDMILRAAENIYPAEIEHRLDEHPDVAEAAVLGVEHEELGQEVLAVVVPVAGRTLDVEELADFVGEKLAKYKVPAHWEIREEPLPRNAAGKVLKNVIAGDVENTFIEE